MQENKTPAEGSLSVEFNALSRGDRAKIRCAAVFLAATAFARADTQAHPWKYPFYTAYIGCWAMGWGGVWLVAAAATVPLAPYVAWMPTPWARKVRAGLSAAFNGAAAAEALCDARADYFRPDPAAPGGVRVRGGRLFGETVRRGWQDMRESSGAFKNAVSRFFGGAPPAAP